MNHTELNFANRAIENEKVNLFYNNLDRVHDALNKLSLNMYDIDYDAGHNEIDNRNSTFKRADSNHTDLMNTKHRSAPKVNLNYNHDHNHNHEHSTNFKHSSASSQRVRDREINANVNMHMHEDGSAMQINTLSDSRYNVQSHYAIGDGEN